MPVSNRQREFDASSNGAPEGDEDGHPPGSVPQVALDLQNMSIEDAYKKLKRQMDDSLPCRLFVEWHATDDPHLEDVDDAQRTLDDLCRSTSLIPSKSPLGKELRSASKAIAKLKKEKSTSWEEVFNAATSKVPYFGLPAELKTLRYVSLDCRFPECVRKYLREVDLEWYIDGKEPSAWWAGARLDDPEWRRIYMEKPPQPRHKTHGRVDANRLVALMRRAFSVPDSDRLASLRRTISKTSRGHLKRVFPGLHRPESATNLEGASLSWSSRPCQSFFTVEASDDEETDQDIQSEDSSSLTTGDSHHEQARNIAEVPTGIDDHHLPPTIAPEQRPVRRTSLRPHDAAKFNGVGENIYDDSDAVNDNSDTSDDNIDLSAPVSMKRAAPASIRGESNKRPRTSTLEREAQPEPEDTRVADVAPQQLSFSSPLEGKINNLESACLAVLNEACKMRAQAAELKEAHEENAILRARVEEAEKMVRDAEEKWLTMTEENGMLKARNKELEVEVSALKGTLDSLRSLLG